VPTKHSFVGRVLVAATLAGVGLTAACSDVTYEARQSLGAPPDAVAGFLGYFNVSEKFPKCGLCHADKAADWSGTAHARAWDDLQASGDTSTSCEPCHTVNANGNWVTGAAGFVAVPDSVYHDVQCESCHGPGADHIADPTVTQPLAPFSAGTDLTTGCGECHSTSQYPFIEQWAQSKHAIGSGFSRGGSSSCNECHNGKVALVEQFGANNRYLEKDDGEVGRITCVVCHDPHGSPNEHQLRAPQEGEATTRNLCIKCHNRITVPEAGTRGPHAAQGPLVLGENIGWWPPGFEWLQGLTSPHGDPDVNEDLCVTCHLEQFDVTDGTGAVVFHSTGHLFEAIPCTDANGVPVAGGDCALTERRFNACAQCHGNPSLALTKYVYIWNKLDRLLKELWNDTDRDHLLETSDAGLLPQVLAAKGGKEFDRSDTLFTFAEGALWNAEVAATDSTTWFSDGEVVVAPRDTVHFSSHRTSANGVHNPWYLEALLKATIQATANYYSLPLPADLDLTLPAAAQAYRDGKK